MAPWLPVIYPVIIVALIGLAIYTHYRTFFLSLPISPWLTVLSFLLPLLAALNAFLLPTLLRRATANPSQAGALGRLLPGALQLGQLILTTVLASLLASDAFPSPVRDCLLETRWKALWTAHDAAAIRRVQDALECCGFRSPKHMAWPFPAKGEPAKDCGRTVACIEPWSKAMQSEAGMNFGIVLTVAALQLASVVLVRAFGEARGLWWWKWVWRVLGLETEEGVGRDDAAWDRGGRRATRPLLASPAGEDLEERDEEGGVGNGYGALGVPTRQSS